MKKQYFSFIFTAALFGCWVQGALGQTPSTPTPTPSSVPSDNTKANKVDSTNTTAIADAQKEDANDRTITQNIRKNVMADKSLSTYAHNIKIVAINGNVTLNGVVRSDHEKASLEAKAVALVGQSRVVNDLKVTPPKG